LNPTIVGIPVWKLLVWFIIKIKIPDSVYSLIARYAIFSKPVSFPHRLLFPEGFLSFINLRANKTKQKVPPINSILYFLINRNNTECMSGVFFFSTPKFVFIVNAFDSLGGFFVEAGRVGECDLTGGITAGDSDEIEAGALPRNIKDKKSLDFYKNSPYPNQVT
jgi:hypothetical protein